MKNLLAAGASAREGLAHGGARLDEKRVPESVLGFVAAETIRQHTSIQPQRDGCLLEAADAGHGPHPGMTVMRSRASSPGDKPFAWAGVLSHAL